jgi:hypothetical protein
MDFEIYSFNLAGGQSRGVAVHAAQDADISKARRILEDATRRRDLGSNVFQRHKISLTVADCIDCEFSKVLDVMTILCLVLAGVKSLSIDTVFTLRLI